MKKRKAHTEPEPPALIALRRAAKIALEDARRTGTACYVWEDGKIVDIAAQPDTPRRARRRKPSTKQKPSKAKRGST